MYKNKPLPTQARKAEVHEWYRKLPTRTVNQVIWAAIEEVNKESIVKTSKRTHVLNRRHLEFIYEELGEP